MTWTDEYTSKLTNTNDLVNRYIGDGTVCFTSGIHAANVILEEIIERIRAHALHNIQFWGISVTKDLGFGELIVPEDEFRYHTLFPMQYERPGFGKSVAPVPMHFCDTENIIKNVAPDIGIIQVTPPNNEGYVSMGPLGISVAGVPYCKRVIAQVNHELPYVFGPDCLIHESEIEAFVEYDEPLYDVPLIEPTREEEMAAAHVAERINDGDTIQVGIGGMGSAICQGLSNKQHLGCFSEMYSIDLARLQRKGVIDNSQKNLYPGVSIAGYSEGSQELYDYLDHNPGVRYLSYSEICNPLVIAKNDNMVSVNSAISVDLTGQVCAESIGSRQYTSTGGQVGYVLGAKLSRGGKSFICMTSVAHTKNGPVSRIAPMLIPGSVVTTLRTDVQYIVTEYGCVDLRYNDVPTRAKKLISIAHPDFRDELTCEAKKAGVLF